MVRARWVVGLVASVVGSGLTLLASPASAAPVTVTFEYTGAVQTWVVPLGVTSATFVVNGAQGGDGGIGLGGRGGRATATIGVTAGDTVGIYVGERGRDDDRSFGGGGTSTEISGGGGGGASDVRIGGAALTDRVLVAGGGGGGYIASCAGIRTDGGAGGGSAGGDGVSCQGAPASGGTDSSGGAPGGVHATSGTFGVGGDGGETIGINTYLGAGGGGGWYGGGGAHGGGGGGGSGHGPAGTVFDTGVRVGNGLVTVTYDGAALAVATTGNGYVTSWIAGIDCRTGSVGHSVCSSTFGLDSPQAVTLTAHPTGPASVFAGWSGGGCSGAASTCTVTMDQARSVTASFAQSSFGLAVATNGTGAGTVTPNPTGTYFAYGTVVTLTAAPDSSSEFTGWSGDCAGAQPTCTVTMDQARSVTATFALSSLELAVTTTGTGTGSVGQDPVGATFDYGTVVTLTAEPDASSTFAGWSGDCVGAERTCTVTMDQARSVTASFTLSPVVHGVKVKPGTFSGQHGKQAVMVVRVSGVAPVVLKVQQIAKRGSVTVTKRLVQGKNVVAFAGKLREPSLTPGTYRLTAWALDADGQPTHAQRTRFRVL